MSLSNGQVADETTFNNAFMSRTDDTNTVGKVDLDNTDVLSGDSVSNIQCFLNAVSSFSGIGLSAVKDFIPAWPDNYVGSSADSLLNRIEALVTRFHGTTGHDHTGVDGHGPAIDASHLGSGTTDSTDKDTGCLILNGGLGVEKAINSGSNIGAVGNMTAGGGMTATGAMSASNLSGTNTGDDPFVKTGTRASPTNVLAAGGIAAPTGRRNLAFVKGNSNALVLTANPQIAAGSAVGDVLTLRVPVGSNTIKFANGTGLSQNGDFELGLDVFSATWMWDGTEWFLIGRD